MREDNISTSKVFDRSVIVREKDPRMYVAKMPIGLDGSHANVDYQWFKPTMPAQKNGIINHPEGNVECTWDLNFNSSDCAFDPVNSELQIDMRFARLDNAYVESNYRTTAGQYDSAPWDALTSMIDSMYVRVSDGSQNISEYTVGNDFGRVALVHWLTNYDRYVLEGMDQTLFTPCLESSLDTSLVMSPESELRTRTWFSDHTVKHHRVISLATLFNCFDRPILLTNCKKLKISIRWKPMNVYKMGYVILGGIYQGSTGIIIEDAQLMVTLARLSVRQGELEVYSNQQGESEQIGFLEKQCYTQRYTGADIVLMPTNHLNAVTVFARAIDYQQNAVAPYMINPSQMLGKLTSVVVPPATTFEFGTGLSTLALKYGTVTIPSMPINLTLERYYDRLYQFYRMFCLNCNDKIMTPAISLKEFKTHYCLISIPLFDSVGMKDSSTGFKILIHLSCDANILPNKTMINNNITIILHTLKCLSIMPDGSTLAIRDTS